MKIAYLSLPGVGVFRRAVGQTPENVTIGMQTFLQYEADLHEADNFNAFDVTRGYLNIRGKLSDSISFRFTPDVRPTTDLNLDRNLTLWLECVARREGQRQRHGAVRPARDAVAHG
jgi:hypothetical protein